MVGLRTCSTDKVSMAAVTGTAGSRRHATEIVMRLYFVGVLCCATLLSASAAGQQGDDFSLGGVRLQLGETEAVVRRQLEENHTITPGGLVMTKDGPYQIVGSVTFKDGKLSWATKDWTWT